MDRAVTYVTHVLILAGNGQGECDHSRSGG